MIIIKHHLVNTIPVLELVNSECQNEKLPLVVFYHGWCNIKESVLINGYKLAQKGIRALLPEALYHGERQVAGGPEQHFLEFWDIIKQNVSEYPMLVQYFADQGLVDREKLGVTGLSMGGITTCSILRTYDWTNAAVCLMGSPNLRQFAEQVCQEVISQGQILPDHTSETIAALKEYDLSAKPEKIAGRPLHFWHGTKDNQVPYQPTYDFYQKIKGEEYGKAVTFKTTNDGHKVPYQISEEMAIFFQKHFTTKDID